MRCTCLSNFHHKLCRIGRAYSKKINNYTFWLAEFSGLEQGLAIGKINCDKCMIFRWQSLKMAMHLLCIKTNSTIVYGLSYLQVNQTKIKKQLPTFVVVLASA